MKIFKIIPAIAAAAVIITDVSLLSAEKRPLRKMKCEDNFTQADTDKDGKISLNEFIAIKHPSGVAPEEMFKSRDTDKDGFLSKDEFCSQGAKRGSRPGKGK